jgi:D-3-phosphoglycerate dehydrogenase / 2-oxoglutarate reductase
VSKRKTVKYTIAISTSSFAKLDKAPLELLKKEDVIVVPNPYQRRLTESEIIEHLQNVDGLLAGLEPLNRKVLYSANKLKAIARVGIGMDNIDMKAAEEIGIRISNTPDGPTEAVAELCLTALLSICRQIIRFNSDMHKPHWEKRIGFGLKGLKVLLIGYGRIGRKFGDFLRFFDSQVMVVDPYLSTENLKHGEILVSLSQGLREADVVSLHASGRKMILGAREFKKLRKGSIILNSARGELIDEEALIQALKDGVVESAWIDSFSKEPYYGKLSDYPQAYLTPHVGTYTHQCRREMEIAAVRNLLNDLKEKSKSK